ncbi:MAG: metal-dependent hydrolase [Candidatus Helarchaeota archaeon]
MVSVLAHMGIAVLCAELILRLRTKDSNIRASKRLKYWTIGLIAGLIPDLDVIPALILGVHSYTFHHIYTHTFLAVGILAIGYFFLRKNELMLPLVSGYYLHLFVDFIDNSISPLGPFDPVTEWGLIAGWGPIPGGGWQSEYWLHPELYPGTENHTLWSIFMNNGWGVPIGIEFLSIYDIVLIIVFFALVVLWIRMLFQNRLKS